MADRYYDRTLECGCMYSSDGGGGLMPCNYGFGCGKEVTRGAYTFKCGDQTKKGKLQMCKDCINQEQKCRKAHEKWWKSKDYKEYNKECIEKNS